jgi:hypothetical protein
MGRWRVGQKRSVSNSETRIHATDKVDILGRRSQRRHDSIRCESRSHRRDAKAPRECGWEIGQPSCDWDIKDAGIKVKVGGKELIVCCDDCAKKAKAEPAKYTGSAK